MPDRPALSYQGIRLSLGQRILFEDFSLDVHAKDKIVLTAPSGSGKTTLLRMALGFVRPDAGHILIEGTALSPQTIRAARGSIAYLSQDIDFREGRVRDILTEIASYPANHGLALSEIESRMDRLGLSPDTMDKHMSELSGGERQRVGIALCAALTRPIWLLDEPLSALDEQSTMAAADLIASTPAAVLAISHHPGLLDTGAFREVRF